MKIIKSKVLIVFKIVIWISILWAVETIEWEYDRGTHTQQGNTEYTTHYLRKKMAVDFFKLSIYLFMNTIEWVKSFDF